MRSHTSGPLHVEFRADGNAEICDSGGCVLATVYGDDSDETCWPVGANARLIAAAPQLLEALSAYQSWMTASFNEEAERFYRATGLMAPGKDEPPGFAGYSYKERRDAWEKWLVERRAELARNGDAAIRAAREG